MDVMRTLIDALNAESILSSVNLTISVNSAARICGKAREKMAQCKNCQYVIAVNESNARGCCTLTRYLVQTDKEHDCQCFNRDLSEYDICYNCEYYGGGGDWGLFCSKKYHHLGKFSDDPCEYYQKKKAKELPTCQVGGEYADAPTMIPGA